MKCSLINTDNENYKMLNEKVTDKYCDICGCNIRNKEKHIITNKHKKELKNTTLVLNKGNNLCSLLDNYLNGNTDIDKTINMIKSLM